MAPRWFEKVESKARRLVQAAPQESASAPLPPTPSSTPSRPASQRATRPISQSMPSLPFPPDSETSPLPSLQEQLWNHAYDKLKASEPKLVETYEKILTTELHRNDSSSVASDLIENKIGRTQETRCRQMQQLVQKGLDRTQREASIKRGIDEGLQAVQAIRGIVDRAVHAAPEAAVAWVGVCLGLEIFSNPITEARDNRNGIAYILSRVDWYWNLVSLLLDENKAEQSSAGLRVQLEKHVIQLYEKLLSYQMKSICLYHRNWAAVVGRDMLKIDDWAGQLSEIQETEAAVQRDMEQYNTEESKTQLRKLTDTASALEVNLQDIRAAIQDQTRKQDKRHQGDKYEKCMQDLHVTDPRKDKKRIQDTKGGLLRGSYCWILEHADFRQFRNDLQKRLLWIKGDPGKGKTMLLCGIIDELEKGTNSLLSYFFCQATEAQLSNAASVLRGLIYLLIIQQPSLISYVRSKYDITGEKLFQGINVWVSLVEILTDMLNDPTLKDAVLVVDALDECTTDRPQLLNFIIQSSSTSSSRVKWIVSSRNWPDIEERLDNAEQKVRLHLELNKDSISEAVDMYIGYRVDRLVRDKKYDRETRDAVESHLTTNADGTFLWVALVCQELADPGVRKRHTLDKLKSFPPGLDPLYERMMEQISNSSDANLCKEILAIASVVHRPITLEELRVLVKSPKDLDQDDLEEIVRSCGSFLTLGESIIYFVHQSAKDFLLKKASNEILPLGIAHKHHAIFSRSLEALSRTLRRDIYNLSVPGLSIDRVSVPDPDPLASIRYSCVYWVDHLDKSNPTKRMGDGDLRDGGVVHEFIRKKYLHWLESLSLLRSMSEGVMAVHKLEALVGNAEARRLVELLFDARRFILSHKPAIEIAPLQVYVSALVFSPEHSLIRELFKNEEPDWMILKPRMEVSWNACLQTLEGHGDWVTSVVFSPDSQGLASGSRDKTVKIWDAAMGAYLQTLEGHSGWVTSVMFSADGQQLASGSYDKMVKIWDIAIGTCLQTLEGHGGWVASVVFSADGQRLASGSYDNTVKIWDVAMGACLQTLEGHSDWVASVVFSADGQRLASGSGDKMVKIWDAAMGTCLQTLEGHSGWVFSVVFSPDGQRLTSGSGDKMVKIWDAATGTCLQTLEGHGNWVVSVVFSPDGQRLASGSGDETVKVWDIATGICLQTFKGHGDWLTSVVFSPDGQRLASGSGDNTVKIWDAATGIYLQTLESYGNWVRVVVFSPDGQRLASVSDDNMVKIWDTATGTCLQMLDHGGSVVAFSPDGLQLALGSGDNMVKIWDTATGTCLQTLDHGGSVVAFSPDGQRLALGSGDNRVKIWDIATGTCLQTFNHSGSVVVFSPDGQQLASGSGDNMVKIWDTATGTCLQTLDHGGSVVVFSPDSQQLASGSHDNIVKIWDTATGACLQTLEGHGYWVRSVVFSADGQRLALGSGPHYGDIAWRRSYSKTVKIWDVATGACQQTLEAGRVMAYLSFDPTTNSRLFTDIGCLDLDLSLATNNQPTGTASRGVYHSGYGISADGLWIVQDQKQMLWLPAEYRALESAVVGSTVAIGCHSGRVIVMKFS